MTTFGFDLKKNLSLLLNLPFFEMSQRKNRDVRLTTLRHQDKQVIARRNCSLNVETMRVQGTAQIDELISDDFMGSEPGGCNIFKVNKITEMTPDAGVVVQNPIPFDRNWFGRAYVTGQSDIVTNGPSSSSFFLDPDLFAVDFQGYGPSFLLPTNPSSPIALFKIPTTYANTCIDDFCVYFDFNCSLKLSTTILTGNEQIILILDNTTQETTVATAHLKWANIEGPDITASIILHDRVRALPGDEFNLNFVYLGYQNGSANITLNGNSNTSTDPAAQSHFEIEICSLQLKTIPTEIQCCAGVNDVNFQYFLPQQGSFDQDYPVEVLFQSDDKIIIVGAAKDFPGAQRDYQMHFRLNTNGTLDTSFGTAGIATSFLSGQLCISNCAAMQADDKFVVGGYLFNFGQPSTCITRWNANGTIDAAFGITGPGYTRGIPPGPMLPTGPMQGNNMDIAVQADGRIVTVTRGGSVFRYTTSGSFDPSFGTVLPGGWYTHVPSAFGDGIALQALALQPDQKILACGYYYDASETKTHGLLFRVNPDGSLDTTFGTAGEIVWDGPPQFYNPFISSPNSDALDVVVLDDGNILVLSQSEFKPYMTLFDTDGNIVRERVINLLDQWPYQNKIPLSPRGRIILSCNQTQCLILTNAFIETGSSLNIFAFMLRISDFEVDTTFGNNGIVTDIIGIQVSYIEGRIGGAALDNNGDFIAAVLDQDQEEIAVRKLLCTAPELIGPTLQDHCLQQFNDGFPLPKSYGFFNITGTPGSSPIDWSTLRIVSVQSYTNQDNELITCGNSYPYGTNTATDISNVGSVFQRIGGVDYGINDDIAGVDFVLPGFEATQYMSFFQNGAGQFQIQLTTNGTTMHNETINYAFKAIINVADLNGIRSNDACCEFFLQRVT